MSRITNTQGLPAPIVAAVENDDYDRGWSDYTVTQLIDPPRKVALIKQHADEIVEDASDLLYALMGKAIHNILERANADGLAEERLYMTIDGVRVGGKFDHHVLEDGTLTDYKVASVWEWMNGIKPEREQQLNLLACLLRGNRRTVTNARAAFIFRDWSKRKARTEADYPDTQAKIVPVKLWEFDDQLAFMEERIALHQAAEKDLPFCTADERWARLPKFAVMKPGRKKALRLLDSEADAAEWIAIKTRPDEKAYVEGRPGESIRCESYCQAAPFCTQWAAIRKELGGE